MPDEEVKEVRQKYPCRKCLLREMDQNAYLKRISMGPLKLPDDLKTGSYRALTQAETDMLMQIKSGK